MGARLFVACRGRRLVSRAIAHRKLLSLQSESINHKLSASLARRAVKPSRSRLAFRSCSCQPKIYVCASSANAPSLDLRFAFPAEWRNCLDTTTTTTNIASKDERLFYLFIYFNSKEGWRQRAVFHNAPKFIISRHHWATAGKFADDKTTSDCLESVFVSPFGHLLSQKKSVKRTREIFHSVEGFEQPLTATKAFFFFSI